MWCPDENEAYDLTPKIWPSRINKTDQHRLTFWTRGERGGRKTNRGKHRYVAMRSLMFVLVFVAACYSDWHVNVRHRFLCSCLGCLQSSHLVWPVGFDRSRQTTRRTQSHVHWFEAVGTQFFSLTFGWILTCKSSLCMGMKWNEVGTGTTLKPVNKSEWWAPTFPNWWSRWIRG